MKLKYCLMAMLLLTLKLCAQTTVHALTIGEQAPDIRFTNIANYTTATAKLSEFKHKLVIIDFWGKYCSSCIATLKKLNTLQEEYGDRIQVITVSDFANKHELLAALARYPATKDFTLPALTQNSLLLQYFPHTLVSHIVWIDGNGVVKAITNGEYINDEDVSEALSGRPLHWPVKKDILDFDYSKTVLKFASADINAKNVYYSAFTSNIEGISPPYGTVDDSANHISITAYYNCTLLSLCEFATDLTSGAAREQFELHVKDSAQYIKPTDAYYDEWSKANTYCYVLQLPSGFTEQETLKLAQQDVLRWLSIKGIYPAIKQAATDSTKTIYTITEKDVTP